MRATALDRLLATASQAIGKRPLAGRTVVPEFMPKHNCALIGNGDRTTDEAASLEAGESQGWRPCPLLRPHRYQRGSPLHDKSAQALPLPVGASASRRRQGRVRGARRNPRFARLQRLSSPLPTKPRGARRRRSRSSRFPRGCCSAGRDLRCWRGGFSLRLAAPNFCFGYGMDRGESVCDSSASYPRAAVDANRCHRDRAGRVGSMLVGSVQAAVIEAGSRFCQR
jgi:hypothetical protein